jgi:hypothetical protein
MARQKNFEPEDTKNPYHGLTREDILDRDKSRRPNYLYHLWPQAPRWGFRGGNQKYLTSGLFWEERRGYSKPYYSIREHEVFHHDQGFWLPSARLIYVCSANEYQGAMRLVGSWEQWQRLKDGTNTFKFDEYLASWEQERQARIIAEAQDALYLKGVVGLDTAAAKEIIRQNGGKVAAIGRPKTSEEQDKTPKSDIDYGKELEGLTDGASISTH